MQVSDAFRLGEPAPRLGVSWDVWGENRSRVWASLGRSYPYLTAGIGQTVVARNPTVDDQTSQFGTSRAVDPGGVLPISTSIQAPHQDEVTFGVELTPVRYVQGTAYFQARRLEDGFDTILGSFDNPGRTNPTTPQAERETEVAGVEVAFAPVKDIVVRAGWAWGRTLGSWTGVFDPRQGVVLYGGDDYAIDFRNMLGPLPTDLGHDLYFEGVKHGHLFSYPVGISTRLSLQSGRPRNVFADADEGFIELLPRGENGRGPMITTANVRLFATVAHFDIQLELFNVFDRQDANSVDEVYVGGEQSVAPIVGGTAEDLIWLKTASGGIPLRHDGYLFPTGYQAPFAAVLGVHRAF